MESWMLPPICTLRTLRGAGAALYTVLEVLPDSQEPSQAYKFDIVCFCKPSHPTRAECTLCEDRTRFDRSRYQTRPPAFPTLHQPCTTSLQHSLLLPSRLKRGLSTSHASGAHWARAHTRLICHVCTQLPSYQYVAPLFSTHHHAKRTASGGRTARQPRSTCPCQKMLAMPKLGPLSRSRPCPAAASAIAMPASPAGETCRAGDSNSPPNRQSSKPLHSVAAEIARVACASPYLQ